MSPVPRGARLALVAALSALVPAAFAGSAAADVNADHLSNVPNAQPKVLGRPVPNKLSRELAEIPQASGADLIDGADPAVAPAFYGYDFTDAAHPLIAIPPLTAEAQKTEPDKNTYLVLSGQKGADPAFDYGTHFVYQGHEAGTPGYITRINLDADRDHRVTLMATKDDNGGRPARLRRLDLGPVRPDAPVHRRAQRAGRRRVAKTLEPGTPAVDLRGMLGSSSYEGIQNDSAGNVWIVEDSGGTTVGARAPAELVRLPLRAE